MRIFRYICLVYMICCFVWVIMPGETVNAQCDIAAIADSKEINPLYLFKAHTEFNKFGNVGVFLVKSVPDLVQKVTDYYNKNGCLCVQNLYIVGNGTSASLYFGDPPDFDFNTYLAFNTEITWKPEMAKLKNLMCGTKSTVWLIGSNVGHCNEAPDFLYKLAQTVNARVMAPVNEIYGGKIVDYMNNGSWQAANPTTKPSHKTASDIKGEIKGTTEKITEYFCPCNGIPYDGIQGCTNSCPVSLNCYANICDAYSTNNTWDNYSGNPVMTAGTAGSWNEYGISQPTILKASPYSMWFSGWGTSDIDSIGYATSPDAINWTESSSNPVLISGTSGDWDDYGVYGPCVIKDGSTYKMWYTGYSSLNKVAQIGYATSSDGVSWEKYSGNPVLTIGTSGAWDEGGVGAPSVIKDGDTYKMWFGGSDISWWWQIGYATSPDGISWTKYSANPVIPYGNTGSWDEWGSDAPSVVKDVSTYHMLFIGFDSNNLASIGHATSTDGITWTESETNPHFSRSYRENSFDTENVAHPALFKDSNESVFKTFYRGYNGSTWAIGCAASASLSGFSASTTTTTVENLTTTSTAESSSTTTTAMESETTTTTTKVVCPAESIYGNNSEETEMLRCLRDGVLIKTPTGREIIKLYYKWSPAIVKAMEEDYELKEEVKELIDHILPLINPKGGQDEKGKKNASNHYQR